MPRGGFDNRPRVLVAKLRADVQAKLRQLDRNVGIERIVADGIEHFGVLAHLGARFGLR